MKLVLMFGPLVLFFAALFMLVNDMRHPVLTKDRCTVIATGTAVGKLRTPDNVLYQQSSNPLNDVAFQCDRFGEAILNDTQIFTTTVKTGHGATITRKDYRYLPVRWAVEVNTGKEKS
jgi:hypothetical protein